MKRFLFSSLSLYALYGFASLAFAKESPSSSSYIKPSIIALDVKDPAFSSSDMELRIRAVAASGDAPAQFRLGYALCYGSSAMPVNPVEGLKLLRLAANAGNDSAQFHLGKIYCEGKGVEKNEARGIEWYQLAADSCNMAAQGNIGIFLYEGRAMEKDKARGLKLMKRALIFDPDGHVPHKAYAYLGEALYYGRDIKKNEAEGLMFLWYSISISQDLRAKANFELIMKSIREEAARGDAHATHMLGLILLKDARRVGEADAKEGLECFERAAASGYAPAQYSLARIYYGGRFTIKKNKVKGIELLKRAADNGHAEAQLALGEMLCYGQEMEEDKERGFEWIDCAAAGGLESAQNYLAMSFCAGDIMKINHADAFKWIENVAEYGFPAAQYYIGLHYYEGKDIEKNEIKGLKCLQLAAEGGDIKAKKMLEDISSKGAK